MLELIHITSQINYGLFSWFELIPLVLINDVSLYDVYMMMYDE